MASLTGNQINNTYQGLLKTDNNAAIGTGAINLTDGLGNQTGLSLELGAQAFRFDQANPHLQIGNDNFTAANYPMSGTAGDSTFLEFMDSAGNFTGSIGQDRYGSIYYSNKHGNQGESHVFDSYNAAGATTPAIIRMDSWNSTNNSDNWFTAYNERITAGSFDGGTSNLTLTKPDGTDIVVNIPSGGGGSAGMVAGTGSYSVKSADALAEPGFPAQAGGSGALALMSNAQANGNNTVALGTSATASGNFSVAISAGSLANSTGNVGIGYNSRAVGTGSCAIGNTASTQGSIGGSTAIGDSSGAEGYQSNAIGYLSDADAQQATAIGSRANMLNSASQGLVIGYNVALNNSNPGGVALGANFSTPFLSNAKDSVNIGSNLQLSGQIYNSLTMGLVAKNHNSNDAVAIGRAAQVVNAPYGLALAAEAKSWSNSGLAIGSNAQSGSGSGNTTTIDASQSIALGNDSQTLAVDSLAIGRNALVQAGANGATAIGHNAVAANAGWTATPQLEVTNYATLNYADDTAAAAGGVPLGGIYHNAGALRIRIS